MSLIQQELGGPWTDFYAELGPNPVAAASLGQARFPFPPPAFPLFVAPLPGVGALPRLRCASLRCAARAGVSVRSALCHFNANWPHGDRAVLES